MRRGSRTAQKQETSQQTDSRKLLQPLRALFKEYISPNISFLVVLAAILVVAAIHTGAHPLERALGLAHGELLLTPQADFLVFDHLTPSGTETLNRELFSVAADRRELVVVKGYGLWRLAILVTLCYGLVLTGVRSMRRLRLRNAVVVFQRKSLLLLSVLVGLGSALCGLGAVAPTLFSLAFFMLMLATTKSKPKVEKVALRLEILDMFRALWGGWLLAQTFGYTSGYGPHFLLGLLGLMFGLAASFFATVKVNFQRRSQEHWESLKPSCRNSFEMGWWESLAVLGILAFSAQLGEDHAYGTVIVLGAFGWGRVAHSLLLRTILTIEPTVSSSHRRESVFRIAAGVWFLLPLITGYLFQGFDQSALMMWLTVLLPLVRYGRPWGSVAEAVTSPSDRLAASSYPSAITPADRAAAHQLSPIQRTAILFMSLPPELSAQLFSELEPEEVQAITLAITQLPTVRPGVRASCIEEFLNPSQRRCHMTTEQAIQVRDKQPLEKWVSEDPRAAGMRLRSGGWVKKSQNKPFKVDFNQATLNIEKPCKAAIVLSCLPEELVEKVLQNVDSPCYEPLSQELLELPFVLPEVRALAVREFLYFSDLAESGVAQNLFWLLERTAGENCTKFASALCRVYFGSGNKLHTCAACSAKFNHGIGLRKHQRQTGHEGSRIEKMKLP